jgi:hypothetical protein
LFCPCFKNTIILEYKGLADQSGRQPEIGNANDKVTLLTTKILIWHLNTLLAIIWLLPDAPDLASINHRQILSTISLACSGAISMMLTVQPDGQGDS